MSNKGALSVKQMAARLAVDVHTVGNWIRDGSLSAVNIARRAGLGRATWRIPLSAVEAFERARAAKPEPVTVRSRRRRQVDRTENEYVFFK